MQLHRAREEFEAAGVKLVLIGQATPRHAAHFRRKLDIDLPVLADEERRSYKLAGFPRASIGQLLGPRSVLSGAKHGARSRVTQGRIIGDAAQLGGVMVIGPGDEVRYQQRERNAGDTIEPADLLAAVS